MISGYGEIESEVIPIDRSCFTPITKQADNPHIAVTGYFVGIEVKDNLRCYQFTGVVEGIPTDHHSTRPVTRKRVNTGNPASACIVANFKEITLLPDHFTIIEVYVVQFFGQ
jgi:hypothetical protein